MNHWALTATSPLRWEVGATWVAIITKPPSRYPYANSARKAISFGIFCFEIKSFLSAITPYANCLSGSVGPHKAQ